MTLLGDTARNGKAIGTCTRSHMPAKAGAHPRKPSTKTSGSLLSPAKPQLNPSELLHELRKQYHTCGLMPQVCCIAIFQAKCEGRTVVGVLCAPVTQHFHLSVRVSLQRAPRSEVHCNAVQCKQHRSRSSRAYDMTVGRRAAFTDALGRATTRGRAPRKPVHPRAHKYCLSTGRPVCLLTRALLLATF